MVTFALRWGYLTLSQYLRIDPGLFMVFDTTLERLEFFL